MLKTALICLIFSAFSAFAQLHMESFASSSNSESIYSAEYVESLAVLQEKFGLAERSRFVYTVTEPETLKEKYAISVAFCLKGNARVCVAEFPRIVIANEVGPELVKNVYFVDQNKTTLDQMAVLARNRHLVVKAEVHQITKWHSPNILLDRRILDFERFVDSGKTVQLVKLDSRHSFTLQFADN